MFKSEDSDEFVYNRWQKDVSSYSMEGVQVYMEPQVSKQGLIITCMLFLCGWVGCIMSAAEASRTLH